MNDIKVLKNGIHLYSESCLPYLQDSGKIASSILQDLIKAAQPGVSTLELNKLADSLLEKNKATAAFKGFEGYPFSTCLSVNEHIVHGFPTNRKLELGDILSIDIGIVFKKFYADNARTIIVGGVSSKHSELVRIAEDAYAEGVKQAIPGNTTGDIGYSIHNRVLDIIDRSTLIPTTKYKVFFNFNGHGIGLSLHEEPMIPNLGYLGKGQVLYEGMCICIEPVVLYRTSNPIDKPTNIPNLFEYITDDGLPSSHHENQLYLSKNGPILITQN